MNTASTQIGYRPVRLRWALHAADALAMMLAGVLAAVVANPRLHGVDELLMSALSGLVMLAASATIYRAWRGGPYGALLGRGLLAWGLTWALLAGGLAISGVGAAPDSPAVPWAALWMGASMVGLMVGRTLVFLGAQLRPVATTLRAQDAPALQRL